MAEKIFNKYKDRGSMHWREMTSRDIRKFNAHQQARYDWIIKSAGELEGKRVLDLGCGDGALTYLLTKRGANAVGVDNDELGIRFAKENSPDSEFVLASAYRLPFEDESFDIVVNCEVIEHLEHPEKMLKEALRVLKPQGKFILTTPYRLTEVPRDNNHVREYFESEMETMLKKYFREVQVKLTHHVLWYGIYTYAFRAFSNRQFGKWLVNALALWLGWNPFMIDYERPTKRDLFTQILGIGVK